MKKDFTGIIDIVRVAPQETMTTHSQSNMSLSNRILTWANQQSSTFSGLKQALHTFVRILLITAREFRKNELSLRASALTYTILLSLVPMLAMSTALIKGLGGDNQLQQVVYGYIEALEQSSNTTEPAPSQFDGTTATETANKDNTSTTLTAHIRSAADKLFDYVDKTDFTTLGSIGVLIMLITIIIVFDTIEKAMNTIWQVQSGRSALRKVTDYLAVLVLMPVAINIGFAATTVIKSPTLLARIEPFLPVIRLQSIFLLLPILFITLALSISYMIFPNTRVRSLPAFIGALLAGSLWFITQNIYISLQIGVSNYNAIYGSFATLPLFLIWLYLGWIFILTGAQVAFACQTHHSYQLLAIVPTPAQQLSAAFDITNQVFLFFDKQQRLTVKMLPELCSGHMPSLLASTLEQLFAAGIIHIESKNQSIFPTLPAEKLNKGAIVKAILGTNASNTEGGRQSRRAIEAASQVLPLNFQEDQNR
ncbi:MAG: YihY/virulence factor BrkB family protein [Proteobacteria bacterium]|nr:YihY/virulence factor BrkB family protein [Pseudomonadota bacterium]MCG2744148.1 YihY/virulence factor BrkB family protein [Desulfobacteraceae bacterium]MBU3983924.1 YihY/virulence factor BrkB family protein [Pseudomonadota bacterium]MBU4028150.1 YihY/virulence factor BrkB family protein [Pseudomonadota bacterium]MBU4043200.1 YihY/virulence factor BrkB family protein [Pseudomonadota bacterium]